MTLTTKCKFCGAGCEVEQSDDCPDDWADRLLAMVCCNRCADFRSGLTSASNDARRVCMELVQFGRKPESEGRVRRLLEPILKRISRVVCQHYEVDVIWDNDFIEQMVEKPDKSWPIISTYVRLVAGEARKQLNEQPMI